MNRKRLIQAALSILVIPFMVAITGIVIAPHTSSTFESKVLAQSSETPAQPEQPAAETPSEPAAESPAEPAEPAAPAEAAKPASKTNWLLIGGGVVAVVVVIALLSSLLRRPRE